MNGNVRDLSKYSQDDVEKLSLIEDVLEEFPLKLSDSFAPDYHIKKVIENEYSMDYDRAEYADFEKNIDASRIKKSVNAYRAIPPSFSKYCPKCGRKYPERENVCLDCLVHLKNLSDKIDVSEIESNPVFIYEGSNDYQSFSDLLDVENLAKVSEFAFTYDDYSKILHDIKSQAFRNFDGLVKENEIEFDELKIVEKIILFVKSFVRVYYKSFGGQLGYFEKDTIFIDDRQTDSLQITTLIHELSHFLIQEIIIHVLCRILDATRNGFMEALAAFILSYIPFTRLIDEYSAHNVEGRFTIFGFQDYSSYLQIEQSLEGEMSKEEIEITKSIGNNFAVSIKDILEALIDKQLRKEIKDQFMIDVLDKPDYMALEMENCQILNDEGFIKAIWLMVNDGCQVAASNVENLESIMG